MRQMTSAKEAPWRVLFARPECLPKTAKCTAKKLVEPMPPNE
jgi:hypothetical protein